MPKVIPYERYGYPCNASSPQEAASCKRQQINTSQNKMNQLHGGSGSSSTVVVPSFPNQGVASPVNANSASQQNNSSNMQANANAKYDCYAYPDGVCPIQGASVSKTSGKAPASQKGGVGAQAEEINWLNPDMIKKLEKIQGRLSMYDVGESGPMVGGRRKIVRKRKSAARKSRGKKRGMKTRKGGHRISRYPMGVAPDGTRSSLIESPVPDFCPVCTGFADVKSYLNWYEAFPDNYNRRHTGGRRKKRAARRTRKGGRLVSRNGKWGCSS